MSNIKVYITRASVEIAALLISATFMFSALTKAIDPDGMCIKLNAYFTHWGFSFTDSSLFVEVCVGTLAVLEFILGVYLLMGMRRRLATRCALVFMILMTLTTIYVAATNPVEDCGCFGTAVALTHTQTLIKNILLLIATILLTLKFPSMTRLISEKTQWMVSAWSLIAFIALLLYSFHYLPRIDFTDYKIGANIRQALFDPESKESYTDLTNFILSSEDGEWVQDSIIAAEGYTFFLVIPDERRANPDAHDVINDINDYCAERKIPFYGILPQEQQPLIPDWKDKTGAAYDMLLGESTQLKAMVRSNPGLILLKNGQIVAKWSNNNLPSEIETTSSLAELEQTVDSRKEIEKILLWIFLPLVLLVLIDTIRHRHKYYNDKNIINFKNTKNMRKKIVAGNWKMNKNLQEGIALAKELTEKLAADKPNCGVVICTPFIHLASVAPILDKEVIGLGAENCADKEKGAYTGEVSAEMVKSTGADYVILGHSERRAYYGETAEILKEKVKLALANDLKVIFCIGEVLEEREAEKQNEVVKAQLEGSLFDLSNEEFANIILAYEPVWAIGTGKTATAEQAEEMHAFIRATIAEKFGVEAAENTTILYGGSCKPSNAKELFAKPDVDGGLIGGAALKADDFKGIIDAWK